jgi:peroxiredoxin Q/BCP
MSRILRVGAKAPAFTLPDQHDDTIKFSDFKGQWVVLYFYPKDDTPGCTTEACDFTGGIKRLEKLNAAVLGVSADSTENHRKFIKKYSLQITLLSDPGHAMMEKYGAWQLKKTYGKEYMGTVRTTYLIDPTGKVAFAWEKVSAEGHAQKVTEKLAELIKILKNANSDIRS